MAPCSTAFECDLILLEASFMSNNLGTSVLLLIKKCNFRIGFDNFEALFEVKLE